MRTKTNKNLVYTWKSQSTEIKTWRHVIWQMEQHEYHWQSYEQCSLVGQVVVVPLVTPIVFYLLRKLHWVMEEETRTGFWLRQMNHIHNHLWHRYSATVNQVYDSDHENFNFTTRTHWFSSFLVRNPDRYNSTYVHWNLLHTNGKIAMGKFNSSLLS
jgi:hypothetical protein